MHKKLVSLMVLTPLLAGLLQAQIVPTTTTSVESYDMPGYFMVCTTSAGAVQLVEGGAETPEGQWNIVTGLTGTGTVSFMPVALDNHYMRHRSYIFYCDPAATDSLYLNDASFTPEPGLADPEDPTLVSFRSVNYTTMYLQHNTSSPMGFALATVAAGNEGAATFRFPEPHTERAKNPAPVDGATDVPRETMLSWRPGVYAASHDVYLGTNFDDVNTATAGSPLLVSPGQDANVYDPPGRLEFGTTYYWRIDEVNAPPDSTVHPGDVWSFTTEPLYYAVQGIVATASLPTADGSGGPEVTVDGSGLTDGQHGTDNPTMWVGDGAAGGPVSIRYDFDRVYKLYGMHIWNYNGVFEYALGLGFNDVTIEYATEPNEWTTLGDYVLDRATSRATYEGQSIPLDPPLSARAIRINVHNNRNLIGLLQYGLSEIQFLYKPVFAREPQPADGATDVSVNTELSWRAGREAASHEVYVSTDSNAVLNGSALAGTAPQPSFDTYPLDLLMGEKYYWMVTEVNEVESPTAWSSDLWDFNTPTFLVVDDFESYTDDPGGEIFIAWEDGYNTDTNGSQVGNNDPPYADEGNIHSGDQCMPFHYQNTSIALRSEAVFTVSATGADWTRADAQALVLWFRGSLGNNPAQLYIKINGGAPINFPGNSASLAAPVWKPWPIALTTLGAAAESVKTLTIGVTGTGIGQLYIDDVRLYRLPPEAAPAPVDPGTAGLVAYYPMSDSTDDASGNDRDGIAQTGCSFTTGPQGYGKAVALDGTAGYVDLPIGSLIASLSDVTFASWVNFDATAGQWQRVFDFGTGTSNYVFLAAQQTGSGTPVTFGILTTGGTEVRAVASRALGSGWHHVAVTLDSAAMNIVLYVDGEPVGSNTTTMLPSDLGETTQNWLGRSQWTNDVYYNGSLDEFRIYNRVLTAGEVQYLAGDR